MEPQPTKPSQPQALYPQRPEHQDRQPEQQKPPAGGSHQVPHLHALIPPSASSLPAPHAKTAASTPVSSPGLFSPTNPRSRSAFTSQPGSDSSTPAIESSSPYLHPLQNRKVRETHKALIDSDSITGRKLINQYEVIEELGRGMHGKVKLARNLETGENVAIKIIPRYSKRRRLGKVMANPAQDQAKTMREIAILKKMRHPNVVSLLEIIDDPELKKIYLILEHVELGEVVWRKKGLPHICAYERRRIEREMRGGPLSAEEEQYDLLLERRQAIKEVKRAKMSQAREGTHDYWSIEHGVADEQSSASQSRSASRDDLTAVERFTGPSSLPASTRQSRSSSQVPSRTQSDKSLSQLSMAAVDGSSIAEEYDIETPGPARSSNPGSSSALDGTMYGPYIEDGALRGRSPSMADSIISHMSSVDWNTHSHERFDDDFSYVPCFTFDQARSVFRDTVLGLEYLHYQGVVHRDIKPANLLWTKDHRVKISDFGVSYFGRPIRDGEPDDETVSESEARDFDDDLELAKTVGTPAFFAPEMCYTDTDREEQPKISEMIDIWSLGVTLYSLIFARIPFQSDDEWALFKRIATEEVLVPKKRLRPVDPATSPDGSSLYKRQNNPPYRDDNDLVYEEIDQNLYDLMKLMFTRNPDHRIRLRDIKRHPWVVQGIANPIAWIDETDPARPSQGRRVQVDARETAHAVVPITFLERARSTMKKAVGKLMHPLVSERGDSRSRRRATSSVASSAGDGVGPSAGQATQTKDSRRKSLKSDDYFSNVKDFAGPSEHPLSQSMNTSPSDPYDPLATAIAQPSRQELPMAGTDAFPELRDSRLSRRRQSHQFLPLTDESAARPMPKTTPATPCKADHFDDSADGDSGRSRSLSPQQEDSSRSQSVDRALFVSDDKRAPPKVGVSATLAPGTVHRMSTRPRSVRSVDLGKAQKANKGLASPLFFSSHAISGYQHGQPQSDSNIYENKTNASELEERPQTAHRIETPQDVPEAKTPATRTYESTAESFAKAKEQMQRKQVEEYHHQLAQRAAAAKSSTDVDPANVPCPTSPDGQDHPRVSRGSTMETGKSSRSTSMAGNTTPLTSPSDVASPVSSSAFPSKEQMLPFQSDPSLPALLSGASSVSAEGEAELPLEPAMICARPEMLETTDSLTPPAMTKEPIAGFPLEHMQQQNSMDGLIAVKLDEVKAPTSMASSTPEPPGVSEEDDDDSDSDEGLVMARNRKNKAPRSSNVDRTPFGVKRRDTGASVASTDTAKHTYSSGNEPTSPRNE